MKWMQKMHKKSKEKKGFTLIELIVVIAIIGILAAIIMPRFGTFTADAKSKAALSEAKNIMTAIDLSYAYNGGMTGVVYERDKQEDVLEVTTNGVTTKFTGVTSYASSEYGKVNTLFILVKDGITVTVKGDGTMN